MKASFQPILEENLEAIRAKRKFNDEVKRDKLVIQDKKDHAFIELSGFLYIVIISVTGFILLGSCMLGNLFFILNGFLL
jgi:hypothetical protein